MYKMSAVFNIDHHLCRMVYHYLSDRRFSVLIDNSLSPNHSIAAGVPQGGVLSASLYILYVADMPLPAAHINPIYRLPFADDILFYVSAKNLFAAKDRLEGYVASTLDYLNRVCTASSTSKLETLTLFLLQR